MKTEAWGWTPMGRQRWGITLLLVGHLLWILLGRGPSGHWQRLMGFVSKPSQAISAKWMEWQGSRSERSKNLQDAEARVRDLSRQLEESRLATAKDAPRVSEADDAIRLLGLKKQLPLPLTKGARVIVNVRKAPFGGMLIDQGSDAGLVADQGILCPEGVVGRIWTVGRQQSSVLPLDSYNASTAVMLGRSRATGILQGVGPGRAEIRYISSQEQVQPGEPVLTSGLDRVFPRGLLVGYVTAVHPRDVELNLEVSLSAPLDRVLLVLILPPHPEMEVQPPSGPPASTAKPKRGAKK